MLNTFMPKMLLLVACSASIHVSMCKADDRELFTVTTNELPDEIPTLVVWQEHNKKKGTWYTNISASFPNVPDFTCDLWCYESPGIEFESAEQLEDGAVRLRHSWADHDATIVTTATPSVGSVEVVARLDPVSKVNGEEEEDYPALNICWQLRRAPAFASEPEPYPEFVRRCFVFTQRGQTFLLDTERRPIPVKPVTHKRNNPPWVQMYLPVDADDKRAGPDNWADYSPDRFTVPVIGAVSRDRKYLTAIGSGSQSMVCQAWHDCMHNNARWLPADDTQGKEWRIVVYAIENDPEELIRRFRADFPDIEPWQKQ